MCGRSEIVGTERLAGMMIQWLLGLLVSSGRAMRVRLVDIEVAPKNRTVPGMVRSTDVKALSAGHGGAQVARRRHPSVMTLESLSGDRRR